MLLGFCVLCVLFSIYSYDLDSNDNHIFAHGINLGATYNIAYLASASTYFCRRFLLVTGNSHPHEGF